MRALISSNVRFAGVRSGCSLVVRSRFIPCMRWLSILRLSQLTSQCLYCWADRSACATRTPRVTFLASLTTNSEPTTFSRSARRSLTMLYPLSFLESSRQHHAKCIPSAAPRQDGSGIRPELHLPNICIAGRDPCPDPCRQALAATRAVPHGAIGGGAGATLEDHRCPRTCPGAAPTEAVARTLDSS
jgi:hypothetical protein